jgi:ubiquinone/menaquinone biosynthesis C-methylase UbiE
MAEVNLSRFSGFADIYDSFRPRPPAEIPEIILSIVGKTHVKTIVDLGSGTGLSTLIWKGFSDKIIGIEPNDDMRSQAEKNNSANGIRYIPSDSYATGLDSASAEIITCSQSFHWMDPVPALAECARILKPGGIFAVYDNDWPPTVDWRAEKAWIDLFTCVQKLTAKHADKLHRDAQMPKERHLANIRNSGYFEFCGETVFQNREECNAERFINLALSQGWLQAILKAEIDEINESLLKFESDVKKNLDSANRIMRIGYRMRYGIRKD